jgi:hypothetical protein
MRRIIFSWFCFLVLCSCVSKNTKDDSVLNDKIIEQSCSQIQYALNVIEKEKVSELRVFPRTINEENELVLVRRRDWTSGFFPGVLWYAYELSGIDSLKIKATCFTELLEEEQYNDSDHDIGFKMMSSYGHAYRLTGNEQYKDILIQSARTLITRFSENVGCIRSWNHHKDKWDYPVIIDNMMNLELLFFAWNITKEPTFYNIGVAHANKTMENHFRDDYSCYHVVSYDTISGEAVAKNTHQGYADESSWARGQAWALYGYTMVYRETNKVEYLEQAENVANYILNVAKLPEDYVPFWDFHDPDIPNAPKDASAAAVMASALYELSAYSDTHKDFYISTANQIMKSLSSDKYFNKVGTNKGFLLAHSTGSLPRNSEIDVPLVYADYYYLEALKRKINIENSQKD